MGQCFVLRPLHRLPSHSFVFTFCLPHSVFSMTVFKIEITSQSVLIWLKVLVIVFLRNIRNAVSILAVKQVCNVFFISCSMDANFVADWWWAIWFDILFSFSQLLNLNPCCKTRATKCLQRTIALCQFKLFNLSPVFWRKYVQTLDNMCDRNQGFFFFLVTYATSFRMMTLYFTMWVNKYSAKDSVYLVFARS